MDEIHFAPFSPGMRNSLVNLSHPMGSCGFQVVRFLDVATTQRARQSPPGFNLFRFSNFWRRRLAPCRPTARCRSSGSGAGCPGGNGRRRRRRRSGPAPTDGSHPKKNRDTSTCNLWSTNVELARGSLSKENRLPDPRKI